MPPIDRSSPSMKPVYRGRHKFEHWYVDDQVYFITARCRDRAPAFAADDAKAVFWDRLDHCTAAHGFTPIVVSLLPNHYHLLGHLRRGRDLGPMMQRLHGSVAKLVNDLLPRRLPSFWRDAGEAQGYFDGCIRDETQCRRAFRYTRGQAVRHGLARRWEDYPHTRVSVGIDRAVRRAHEIGAFLEGVPYKRYEGRGSGPSR